MNPVAVLFLISTSLALIVLPRRWALLPLLMGACYMTNAQSIDIGPFHFTVLRVLLCLGFVRSIAKGEKLTGGLIGLDKIVITWAIWLMISSVFHSPFLDAVVFRMGAIYNVIGVYFFIRVYCRNLDDLDQITAIVAIVLMPVAIEMCVELATRKNLFSVFGGVPPNVIIREGKLRAQGPFGHPILAGTVGAVFVPLMIGIFRRHKLASKIGLAAGIMMTVTSNSSGPLMTLIFGLVGLSAWKWRKFIPAIKAMSLILYLVATVVMTRPAYFLLEKIDLTGSSGGYHRAAIIDAGIKHFSEWWVGGTDYTRSWMPTGVSWNPNHTDITNHYLYYGVEGGLPSMLLLIAMVWTAFTYVRKYMKMTRDEPVKDRFLLWCLGAMLFAHTTTMISVAYFDQSIVFLYFNFAVIGSLYITILTQARRQAATDPVLVVNNSAL